MSIAGPNLKTLLIEDLPEGSRGTAKTRALLEGKWDGEVSEARTLQEAIESLEVAKQRFDFIICDYRGRSHSLLKCFLAVSADCPCVLLVSDDEDVSDLLLVSRNAILETVPHSEVAAALDSILERFRESIAEGGETDASFIRIETQGLELVRTLWADVYLRLAPNRYCRRFRKQDGFDAVDLAALKSKGIAEIFLKRDQGRVFLENQSERLDTAQRVDGGDGAELRRASLASLEIIHDVVERAGFSPEAQQIAKKTVNTMLKAIGNSPSFSPILTRMRKSRGKYIASHSVMLAEIACAAAHSIGWGSAALFEKLCLASFIHDLSLNDNELAQVQTLDELKNAGVSAESAHLFKLHPIKAAEYAAQFQGIPSDVEIILLQHHELPDGSGFPRGLYHHQIHAVACIFLISHDLLHFFLEQVPTNDRSKMLGIFLRKTSAKYSNGLFAKIHQSLESGIPLKEAIKSD